MVDWFMSLEKVARWALFDFLIFVVLPTLWLYIMKEKNDGGLFKKVSQKEEFNYEYTLEWGHYRNSGNCRSDTHRLVNSDLFEKISPDKPTATAKKASKHPRRRRAPTKWTEC